MVLLNIASHSRLVVCLTPKKSQAVARLRSWLTALGETNSRDVYHPCAWQNVHLQRSSPTSLLLSPFQVQHPRPQRIKYVSWTWFISPSTQPWLLQEAVVCVSTPLCIAPISATYFLALYVFFLIGFDNLESYIMYYLKLGELTS